MRISDWSSDVCSSDLVGRVQTAAQPDLQDAEVGGRAGEGDEGGGGGGLEEGDRIVAVGGLAGFQCGDQLGVADLPPGDPDALVRSEEHTSELQSLMRISYAVFCLKKNKIIQRILEQL